MKFRHTLEDRERHGPSRFVGSYINYKRLKKALKAAKEGTRVTASRSFVADLEREIDRINAVVLAEQREIGVLQVEVVRLRDDSLVTPRDRVILEGTLWKRISELRTFVETAYETVYKAMKKHDKVTGLELMASVRMLLRWAALTQATFPCLAARSQFLSETDRQPFMEVLWPTGSAQPTETQRSAGLEASVAAPVLAPSGTVEASDRLPVPPQNVPWDAPLLAHASMVADMQDRFDAALTSSVEIASAALQIISPELQEGSVDWAQRLTKLVAVSDSARARVSDCASRSSATVRELHEVIQAQKLELLRYVIKAVLRSLELVSPDGAAALELVLQAMRPDMHPPRTRRIDVIAAMRNRVGAGSGVEAFVRRLTSGDANSQSNAHNGTALSSADARHHLSDSCVAQAPAIVCGSAVLSQKNPDAAAAALVPQEGAGLALLPQAPVGDGSSHPVNSQSRLLLRSSSHAGSSIRDLVTRASSRRIVVPGSIAMSRMALPFWKRLGLVVVGVAPLDILSREAEDAQSLGDDDEVRQQRTWTWPSLRKALWRVHRPVAMRWLLEYSFRKHLLGDVVAGVTIGIVLIPQGLAYATLAGLPPVYGLYTGLPAIVYAFCGSSAQAAIGPMSIPALLLASGVASMSPVPQGQDYIDAVLSISLLVGVLLFALGFFNMGFLVRFASRPVLSGFTMASALLTIASVMKDLLGVPVARSQEMYSYIFDIAVALPQTKWPTVLTSTVAIGLLVLLPKLQWTKKVPAPLQVVALSIAIFAAWHSASDAHVYGAGELPPGGAYVNPAGIALVGFVPSAVPTPRLPGIPQSNIPQVFATAFGVILVGFVESIAVATLYAQKHGYEVYTSTELKAVGLTNIVGSILGSFPVMGGFSRSSLCDGAGAKTPLNGAVSAVTVLILLFCVTPALYYLPSCVLSASIVMAVAKLIDIRGARDLWRKDKRDFITMLTALCATLMLGVLMGVVVSMAFSLVIFLAITTQPTIEELGRLQGTATYCRLGSVGVSRVPDVLILKFLAPLFFANCAVLKDRANLELLQRQELPPRLRWRALILSFSSVASIDSTSIQVLDDILLQYHRAGLPMLLVGPSVPVERALQASGFIERLGGRSFIVHRCHDAVNAVMNGSVSSAVLPQQQFASPADPVAAVASHGTTAGVVRTRHSGFRFFRQSQPRIQLVRQPSRLSLQNTASQGSAEAHSKEQSLRSPSLLRSALRQSAPRGGSARTAVTARVVPLGIGGDEDDDMLPLPLELTTVVPSSG